MWKIINEIGTSNRVWKYSGQSPPKWLETTEEEQTSADSDKDEGDLSIGERGQATTVIENGVDQSHSDPNYRRSHSDKQHSSDFGRRSTRQWKPPERYGQISV